MSVNNLRFAVIIFFGGTILACIGSGSWLLNGENNIINALASFSTIQINVVGGWSVAKGLFIFLDALVTALSWSYPFLSSPWAIFIKFPLWLVSIGVIWAIVDGAKGIVDGLAGVIKTLARTGT